MKAFKRFASTELTEEEKLKLSSIEAVFDDMRRLNRVPVRINTVTKEDRQKLYGKPKIRNGKSLCRVRGCSARHKAKGMCSAHYQRATTGSGNTELDGRLSNKACSFSGCLGKHCGRNLCRLHYNRDAAVKLKKEEWRKRRELTSPGLVRSSMKRDRYKARPESRFKQLLYSSKKRQFPVNITFQEFLGLCYLPCAYCGAAPNEKNQGSNLDRIDNRYGYVLENIVPCCGDCNKLKGELLTYEETLKIISLLKDLRGGTAW